MGFASHVLIYLCMLGTPILWAAMGCHNHPKLKKTDKGINGISFCLHHDPLPFGHSKWSLYIGQRTRTIIWDRIPGYQYHPWVIKIHPAISNSIWWVSIHNHHVEHLFEKSSLFPRGNQSPNPNWITSPNPNTVSPPNSVPPNPQLPHGLGPCTRDRRWAVHLWDLHPLHPNERNGQWPAVKAWRFSVEFTSESGWVEPKSWSCWKYFLGVRQGQDSVASVQIPWNIIVFLLELPWVGGSSYPHCRQGSIRNWYPTAVFYRMEWRWYKAVSSPPKGQMLPTK